MTKQNLAVYTQCTLLVSFLVSHFISSKNATMTVVPYDEMLSQTLTKQIHFAKIFMPK